MNTEFQPQRIDKLSNFAIAIQRPLLMLVENGPAFSVIMALHVSADPGDGEVLLEDCTQMRIEGDGSGVVRRFRNIVVVRDLDTNCWVASPDGFISLFSQPSLDPYVIVQLSN
ncbi:MAG: hypothetical protein AAF492_15620, partial [Verrucomicrobiota bacterium]